MLHFGNIFLTFLYLSQIIARMEITLSQIQAGIIPGIYV